jgi:ribosomal protein S18 acetylase RimI-like enzyme
MTGWPSLGSRVSIRFRLPGGSEKRMTDVIGYLEAVTPELVVRTKSDGLVTVSPEDVVSVRELSAIPVRTSEIRALEHAAALAWPGTEHEWHDGWLLRAASGYTSRGNSAVPLDFSATVAALPGVLEWYSARGLPAWLALPERLLPIRAGGSKTVRVMTAELTGGESGASVLLADRPDRDWMAAYQRDVPVEVLTAVVDGELTFASSAGSAVGRGAVTCAPDGTRWLGISAVNTVAAERRRGHARAICRALQTWGAQAGAHRAYVQVLADNSAAIELYEGLGFRLHHHHRYVDARALTARTL